jgi:hypothetical protein
MYVSFLSTTFVWNTFHSNKYLDCNAWVMLKLSTEMHESLSVKNLLLLSDFNKN